MRVYLCALAGAVLSFACSTGAWAAESKTTSGTDNSIQCDDSAPVRNFDSLTENPLCKTFNLFGPFKITAGEVDSKLGAALSGSYDQKITSLPQWSTDLAKVGKLGSPSYTDVTSGLMYSLSADGSWRSGSGSNNYLTLVAQPEFFQTFDVVTPAQRAWHPPKDCPPLPSDQIGAWAKCRVPKGPVYRDQDTPWFGYAPYLDLEYRVGKIAQAGSTYNANQFIYGGGVHLFYPAQIGPFWAAPPFVSATYDKISSTGDNNLPAPDGVKDNYLTTDGSVAIFVPLTNKLTCHKWTASAKLTGSHPTSGGGGWEVSRTYELQIQVGSSLKPALTYKSGTDKGMTYDQQLLLGVVWSFLENVHDTSCDS